MIILDDLAQRWSAAYHELRDLSAEQQLVCLRQMLDAMRAEAAQSDTLAKLRADQMLAALALMLASEAQMPFVLEIVRLFERVSESDAHATAAPSAAAETAEGETLAAVRLLAE